MATTMKQLEAKLDALVNALGANQSGTNTKAGKSRKGKGKSFKGHAELEPMAAELYAACEDAGMVRSPAKNGKSLTYFTSTGGYWFRIGQNIK